MGNHLCSSSSNIADDEESFRKSVERVAGTALTRLDDLSNVGSTTFFRGQSKHIWKCRFEKDLCEYRRYVRNLNEILKLPDSDYVLKPKHVRRVGNHVVLTCMDYGKEDLYMSCQRPFDVWKMMDTLAHLAHGIHWLHSQGLAHRDVKPENVVLHNGKYKWIDFEFTSVLEEWMICGSANYLAPYKVMQQWSTNMKMRSRQMDVFAFGKVIFFVLWAAASHYSIDHGQYLYKMFLADFAVSMVQPFEGDLKDWVLCALKCCQSIPPLSIPLPATVSKTVHAYDQVTIRTASQMVFADN